MKTKILFLLSAFFFMSESFSQIKVENLRELNTLPKEKVFVHFNSNLLLTGETLAYKTYCLIDKKYSTLSKIIYVELIDSSLKTVAIDKVILENGKGQGDFFISSELKSGNYKLIAYTKWMQNSNSFFQEDVFIINPYANKISASENSIFSKEIIKESNSLKLPKTVFNKRDKVAFNVPNEILNNGNYSISVRKKIPQIKNKINSSEFSDKRNSDNKVNNPIILPDFRGQLITGKVIDKRSKQPVKNKSVGISFLGKKGFFKITNTNQNGEFHTVLDEKTYPSNIYAEVLNGNSKYYSISLVDKPKLDLSKLKFNKLKISTELSKTINKQSIYNQINNAYKKEDSLVNHKPEESIYKKDFITYKLRDFTHFRTIEEIMIEIVNGAWINKSGNDYTFSVRNNTFVSYSETLLVVDGYIITNHNSIIDINTKSINTISISNKNYLFNSKVYDGIISIETYNGNFKPVLNNSSKISISDLEAIKIYNSPNYAKENNKRIPDYRTQLYWEPNIDLTKKEISFYTSDIAGNFEIEIEGFTNNGKPISLKKTITVQ